MSHRYFLETGIKDDKNIHLYTALGYRRIGEKMVSDKVTLVYFEKVTA